MSDDAALGEEEAAVALEEHLQVLRQPVCRKAPRHLGAVELLVLEPVLHARANGAFEDPRPAFDRAGDEEKLLSGLLLELAPELVGTLEERNVAGCSKYASRMIRVTP